MASKLLNTSKKNEKSGSLWTLNRFVHSADIATYTYVEGADASALTGIANSYILDYKQSKCGNHYYVQIVAVTDRWALTDTKQENKNGTIWEFNYRVAKADIATYTYDYGDSADILTSGTGTYILKWDRVELPNYYLVKVTAVTAGYENDNSGGSFTTSSKTYRSYDIGQFVFLPEWFGARKAERKDDEDGILEFATGHACFQGEYIYMNATSGNKGTRNLTLCPFSNFASATDEHISEIIQAVVPSVIYTVTFLTTLSVNNFESFIGVSGSFGSESTSPDTTGAGKWRSVGQSVQEDGKTIAGTTYNIVTRKCELAPTVFGTQLLWDVNKNGGTWSW